MYKGKANMNFCNKDVPKENNVYECLSLILLDIVDKVNKKYYS